MRKKQIIYMNDARYYYLFVLEPPLTLEEAWVPVDEVAGTAVDTFRYGVSGGGWTVLSIRSRIFLRWKRFPTKR